MNINYCTNMERLKDATELKQNDEKTETFDDSRRSRLISRRNQCLIARFYYWSEIRRLRFDDTIYKLQEEEFFIKKRNIINILKSFGWYLDILVTKCPEAKQLKKDYPGFNWNKR